MADLDAREILWLLDQPTKDYRPLRGRLARAASAAALNSALAAATTPIARRILCYVVAERCVEAAVPTLIGYLDDPTVGAQAAEALEKIGDPRAGPVLFARLSAPDGG